MAEGHVSANTQDPGSGLWLRKCRLGMMPSQWSGVRRQEKDRSWSVHNHLWQPLMQQESVASAKSGTKGTSETTPAAHLEVVSPEAHALAPSALPGGAPAELPGGLLQDALPPGCLRLVCAPQEGMVINTW